MHNVRLTDKQIQEITRAFHESFLEQDKLWLFGSRIDSTKRGGDIDLFVETSIKNAKAVVEARIKFLTQMYISIGEQKIDVIIKFDDTDLDIYKVAKSEGVRLV